MLCARLMPWLPEAPWAVSLPAIMCWHGQVVCIFKAGIMKPQLHMLQQLAPFYHLSLLSGLAWPKE